MLLDLAPVALDAGFLGPRAADWLGGLAKAAPNAPLAFHMDPLTAFAQAGASPGPIEGHLVSAATVGARLAQTYAKASLMLAAGRAAHEAGGSNTEELAVMAACALAYAKALVRAGLSMEEAFSRIVLGVSLDAEYFTGVSQGPRRPGALGADHRRLRRLGPRRDRGPLVPAHADPGRRLDQPAAPDLARASPARSAGRTPSCWAPSPTPSACPTALRPSPGRNTQLVLMEENSCWAVSPTRPAARGTWTA